MMNQPFSLRKSPALRIRLHKDQQTQDISQLITERVINLTLTDNRSFEADQLDIELDDSDHRLELPQRGAILSVAFGWSENFLYDKGRYIVNEIEHSGAPDKLTIRAHSADFRAALNTRKDKSWHQKTLGDIVQSIAIAHDLTPAINQELGVCKIEHIDQTGESDCSFLVRLAEKFDAMATVKNGHLLFMPKGQGVSASGKKLPLITLTRCSGDNHRFSLVDREAYTGVKASWLNTNEPEQENSTSVHIKSRKKQKSTAKQGDYLVGQEDNLLVLNHTYSNEQNAKRAALAKWQKLQRGVASFSIQLAEGRPELFTEMPVRVSGFKSQIDSTDWIITTLTHSISADSGFTTSVDLELRQENITKK